MKNEQDTRAGSSVPEHSPERATASPDEASPEAGGRAQGAPWHIEHTFSTHNHPERYWETHGYLGNVLMFTSYGATQAESYENGQRIVSAVNAHAALLAAAHESARWWGDLESGLRLAAEKGATRVDVGDLWKVAQHAQAITRAAIAKAEGR